MKNEKNNKMPKAFRIYICVIACAVLVGIITASIGYFVINRPLRNSSVNIEFAYEGATYKLTPTGDAFSIDTIKDENLISKALTAAGFSGKYTPQQIIQNMSTDGLYPKDVIEKIKEFNSLYNFSESRSVSQNNYYPTAYSIKLYDDFDPSISDGDLEKIVKTIAETYKEAFMKEYVYVLDISEFNKLLILDDYDYFQRTKILKMKFNLLKRYARELSDLDSSFKYNGMSFNDLILRCNSIANDYILNTEAVIITDGITTSKDRLRNQYEYELQLLENEKTYKEENLKELEALINSYQTDQVLYIGSGDSMVKIDSNSKITYESLVDRKRTLSDDLVEIDADMDRYELYLEKLNSANEGSPANDIMSIISTVDKKTNELFGTFKEMLQAYNEMILPDYSVILGNPQYNGAKLLSGAFIIALIKSTAPLVIVVLCLCSLHALICSIRNYKKRPVQD